MYFLFVNIYMYLYIVYIYVYFINEFNNFYNNDIEYIKYVLMKYLILISLNSFKV